MDGPVLHPSDHSSIATTIKQSRRNIIDFQKEKAMSDLTKSKTDYQEESKQQAEQQQIVIVTRLETNDVVMGRGAQAVAHLGNISFREIVSSRRQEVCMYACMHARVWVSLWLLLLLLCERAGSFQASLLASSTAKKRIHSPWTLDECVSLFVLLCPCFDILSYTSTLIQPSAKTRTL
jgi:hypothetical protein